MTSLGRSGNTEDEQRARGADAVLQRAAAEAVRKDTDEKQSGTSCLKKGKYGDSKEMHLVEKSVS